MLRLRRILGTIAMTLLVMGLVAGCRHTAQDRPYSGGPPNQDARDGGGNGGGNGGGY